jgi:hypothetical protein
MITRGGLRKDRRLRQTDGDLGVSETKAKSLSQTKIGDSSRGRDDDEG